MRATRRISLTLYVLTLLTAALAGISCTSKPTSAAGGGTSDTLQLRYARHITLLEHEGTTEALIANPWQKGALLARHEIRQPLTHAALFTASVAALMDELGCLDKISGVCEPEYIANAHIHNAIENRQIINLGSAMTPSREAIAELSPDGILLSPFENVGVVGGLDKLGIPIIPCADYMEATPLARAEWMRFYGRLFGCGERADSLFAAVEQDYLAIKDEANGLEGKRPSVFFDTRNGSAWYMPGGESTLGQMVADAGGRYVFGDNRQSGSVPYSFEQVLDSCSTADVWLVRYSAPKRMTRDELRREYEPYSRFDAFRKQQVWGCNNSELHFFEEYPFHPERLLHDFKLIFSAVATDSADALPDSTLHYFHRL